MSCFKMLLPHLAAQLSPSSEELLTNWHREQDSLLIQCHSGRAESLKILKGTFGRGQWCPQGILQGCYLVVCKNLRVLRYFTNLSWEVAVEPMGPFARWPMGLAECSVGPWAILGGCQWIIHINVSISRRTLVLLFSPHIPG